MLLYCDMDYVVVSLGEGACVSFIVAASYCHVSLGVREFIVAIDRRCMFLL